MIWESGPWKQQLVRDAARLRRLGNSRLDADGGDKEVFQLERQVFIAAYTMRKLSEAGKLSSNWDHQRLACLRFPIKGKDIPDRLNWHHIDRHYDLNASLNVKMNPKEFCDRIIHSFVFVPCIGSEETIKSFYFTYAPSRHLVDRFGRRSGFDDRHRKRLPQLWPLGKTRGWPTRYVVRSWRTACRLD
jgi:hypothetical protein